MADEFLDLRARPAHDTLTGRLLRRLRAIHSSTLLVYASGVAAIFVWGGFIQAFDELGFAFASLFTLTPMLLVALTMMLVVQLSTGSASEMIQKPWKFMLAALAATVLSYGVIAIYDYAFDLGIFSWWANQHVFPKYFRYGIFFGALGWLSLHFQQNEEDRARFATLFARHSMLTREIAQSHLLATRAQIAPQLVVRILGKVHLLYQTDAHAASGLIDQLIVYLRLAMNRMREKELPLSSEIAMIHAYLALRQAESGMNIDCRIEHGNSVAHGRRSSEPVFLVAQKMIDAAIAAGTDDLSFCFAVLPDTLVASAARHAPVFSDDDFSQLKKDLASISKPASESLHHESLADEHVCSVKLPA